MRLNEKEIDPKGHATDLFSDWSIDYLKKASNSKQPFFLYLAYNAPHTPIQPPSEWLQKIKDRETGISEKRARLVAFIEHLDDGIGRVIDTLKSNKMYENTLIIFASDNGGLLRVGANNGNLRDGKQSMYEGGIRVPMCCVWHKHIKAGTISDQIAITMDLVPTICDAAETKINKPIDGVSILPILTGEKKTLKDRCLFWVRREGNRYAGRVYYAARHGKWKLMQNNPFEPYQMFDLENDPQEQQPLDQGHKMYKILRDKLRDHIIAAGAVPWQKPTK